MREEYFHPKLIGRHDLEKMPAKIVAWQTGFRVKFALPSGASARVGKVEQRAGRGV